MATVNGVSGFTQYPRLNVIESLLIDGQPVSSASAFLNPLFTGESTATSQEPTATDEALQVEFGPAQTTEEADLAADGKTTIKKAGLYQFNFVYTAGRSGTSGTARLFGRVLLNGQQSTSSIYRAITNQNDGDQIIFTVLANLNSNDEITTEIIRDSTGNNNGGLFQQDPTAPGWNTTPSAKITCSILASNPAGSANSFLIQIQP